MKKMDDQPHFDNPLWVDTQAFYWCSENPDSHLCDHVRSFYEYDINLAANAVFLGFFGASLVAYAVTLGLTRRAVAFNVAMMLGLISEVLGYVGRVMSWSNPWDENGFLMQICCLTIGPAFMAAGLYLCLRRIVTAYGPENSRIAPEYFTRLFIPCDVIALILQAVGGALASTASHEHKSVDVGTNIMIAGLAFQVFTIVCFITASTDFAIRVSRRQRAMGASALDQNPVLVELRKTWRFKGFLAALGLATICILWRSAFRVAELSRGFSGPVIGRQDLFIGFEGVLIVVAVLVLNIFHPAWCMKELLVAGGGLKGLWWSRGRKSKDVNESEPKQQEGSSDGIPA